MNTPDIVYLFSYGTLQDRNVQISSFGRELAGRPDALPGYAQTLLAIGDPKVVEISGKTHHPVVRPSANPATNEAATTTRKPIPTAGQRIILCLRVRSTAPV